MSNILTYEINMGANLCSNCKDIYRESEITVDNNGQLLQLAHCKNLASKACKYSSRLTTSRTDPKLLKIMNNQLAYGNNPQVSAVEAKYGPFHIDTEFPDTLPTTVVGPLVQENKATYYGQWHVLLSA